MSHPLSKPLLIGLVSLSAPIALKNANPAVLLPAIGLSACGVVTAGAKLKDASLSDMFDGLGQLAVDWVGIEQSQEIEPLEPLKIVRPESVGSFLKGLVNADVDPTTPNFWTPKRANTSAMIVGARGSGKSKLFAYRFQQCIADGIHVLLSDLHYDAEDEQKTEWLPGVEASEFRQRYLLNTAEATLKALNALAIIVKQRVSGEDKTTTPHHLFIDEWGGCWRRWDESQQESATEALKTIVDEGRKAKVNISLSLHQLKKTNDGIDSSIVAGADLYLMGRTLADNANQVPSDLDRKSLQKERNEKAIAIGTPQRALVHVDYLSGEATVVISPNLMTPLQFEVMAPKNDFEAWFTDNQSAVDAFINEGKSLRQITDHFGLVRSLESPIYTGLKAYTEAKRAA